LSLLLASCGGSAWMSQDFNVGRVDSNKVSILPPQITGLERTGRGMLPDSTREPEMIKNVEQAAQDIINGGGFVGKSAIAIEDSTFRSPGMARFLEKLRAAYKGYCDSMHVSDNGATTPLPVLQELNYLSNRLRTRYVLFIRGTGYTTPESYKQHDLLQLDSFRLFFDHPLEYQYQWSGLMLDIALVDMKSATVLWYNRNRENESKYDPLSIDRVKDLCSKLMSNQ
jgi:hypothetical protein